MENIKTWDDVVENVVENIVGNIHVQHVPHDMVNVLHDMGGMSWGTLVFFTCCPRHPPLVAHDMGDVVEVCRGHIWIYRCRVGL